MNDLNSVIVEGKVEVKLSETLFYIVTKRTSRNEDGTENIIPTSVRIQTSTRLPSVNKGDDIRVVGRLAQDVEGGLMLVAEHIEIKKKPELKEVEILVEEIISDTFTVCVPDNMDISSEEFKEYIRDKYRNQEIVLEPGNLELAHYKVCDEDGATDIDTDWVEM